MNIHSKPAGFDRRATPTIGKPPPRSAKSGLAIPLVCQYGAGGCCCCTQHTLFFSLSTLSLVGCGSIRPRDRSRLLRLIAPGVNFGRIGDAARRFAARGKERITERVPGNFPDDTWNYECKCALFSFGRLYTGRRQNSLQLKFDKRPVSDLFNYESILRVLY